MEPSIWVPAIVALVREIIWLLGSGQDGGEPDPDNLRPTLRWADLKVFAPGTTATYAAGRACERAEKGEAGRAFAHACAAAAELAGLSAKRLARGVTDAYFISPALARRVLDAAEEVLV